MRDRDKKDAFALFIELVMSERKRFVRVAADLDLLWPQAVMLWRVSESEGGLPMSALAEHAGCDPSNITGVADKMEALGLLRREPSPRDRRVKLLVLTDEGKRLARRLTDKLYEAPRWLASLSAADQRHLREILERALATTEG